MNDIAPIEVENVAQALRLITIARDLGLKTTYFPMGGTNDQEDQPVRHIMGIQGNPRKIRDFLKNFVL